MDRVVFDAFAVLAWLKDETGADFVGAVLADASIGKSWAGICAVNLGEVYYISARERGRAHADAALRYLRHLAWDVLPAPNRLVWEAAKYKARFPISYADAFALACARDQGADLVTGDPELLAAPHGVNVRWV